MVMKTRQRGERMGFVTHLRTK